MWIENVDVPPGKYIASGSVITHQSQADRLPDVQEADSMFARHVVSINQKLRQGYLCAEDDLCLASIRHESNGYSTVQPGAGNSAHPSSRLNSKVIAWIREVLSQKFYIGVEQADRRRFRANSWSDCRMMKTTEEKEAIATLAQLLRSYPHQYVRLFVINPRTRQRGNTLIIQPDPAEVKE